MRVAEVASTEPAESGERRGQVRAAVHQPAKRSPRRYENEFCELVRRFWLRRITAAELDVVRALASSSYPRRWCAPG